jgi:hypothetical protein
MQRTASRRSPRPISRLDYKEQTDESSDSDESTAVSSSEEDDSGDELLHNHKRVKKMKSRMAIFQEESSSDDSAKENDDLQLPLKKRALSPMSEFEAKRLKNIEERQNIFKQLNMGNLKFEMENQLMEKRAALKAKRKLLKSTRPREAVRKSVRLSGRYKPKPLKRLMKRKVKRRRATANDEMISTMIYNGGWKSKRKNWQTALSLDKTLRKSYIGKENSKLLHDCCMRMCLGKVEDEGMLEPDRCSLEKFKDSMDYLTLKEEQIVKVI